ncbi:MAG TPA: peptide ABC transporter substrate-binding protein [Phycisphaerae bacterium]|nr:peptide ABC transporter substrate-binding protein [Phycisphaerae bacterium]
MKRVLLIPCLLLLLLGVVAYFASAGPLRVGKQRPIVVCYVDDVKTLDVGQMSWMNDIRTAMALWEGLATYGPDSLKPIPGAAESWEISPDQKTYTFHLRKNAKWSNGDPVTSADFLFAWKRVFEPATRANYVTLMYVIEGAEEYAKLRGDNKPADWSTVGVRAPDPYTLVVKLKYPRSYFLDLCAFPTFFPVNEKAMAPFLNDPGDPSKGFREQWERSPNLVTNGAYFLKDWKFKQHLLMEPNAYYWDRGNVKCDQLVITSIADQRAALLAYQSGTVDVLTTVPQQFGEDLLKQMDEGRTDIHYRPVFGTFYYIFNCTKAPLTDARVRKALSLAVDREKITTDVMRMRNRPLGLFVPPDAIPGYKSPEALEPNVEEAKRLLAEAGYPGGKGMRSIEIVYNTEGSHGKIAQAIGQMWETNLGVKVTYRALERGSFATVRQIEHSFDVARAGWYGDYTDPTTWLNLAATGDENNDGLYSNPEYDALLAKAAAAPDAQMRLDLLSEAEGMLVQKEFPFLYLYQYCDGFMYDGKKIGGLEMNVRMLTELKWIYRK